MKTINDWLNSSPLLYRYHPFLQKLTFFHRWEYSRFRRAAWLQFYGHMFRWEDVAPQKRADNRKWMTYLSGFALLQRLRPTENCRFVAFFVVLTIGTWLRVLNIIKPVYNYWRMLIYTSELRLVLDIWISLQLAFYCLYRSESPTLFLDNNLDTTYRL